MISRLKNSFTDSSFGKKAGATALMVGALSLPFAAANADDTQMQKVNLQQPATCAPLEKTGYGMEWDASYSAHKYSRNNVGSIGISIFPGADLDNFTADELGAKLVSLFESTGVQAKCFVNNSQFSNSGTALGFKIGGLSITIDGDNSFNMDQVAQDKRILRTAISEAKTANQLLASGSFARLDR